MGTRNRMLVVVGGGLLLLAGAADAGSSKYGFADKPGRYRLLTMRSNDQFNTTIYGFSDRLRGLSDREIVLMHPSEITRLGLTEGQVVTLVCAIEDGIDRRVGGLKVTGYDLPMGCIAGYYPELNPLVPLGYHEKHSLTPAYKGTPVEVVT